MQWNWNIALETNGRARYHYRNRTCPTSIPSLHSEHHHQTKTHKLIQRKGLKRDIKKKKFILYFDLWARIPTERILNKMSQLTSVEDIIKLITLFISIKNTKICNDQLSLSYSFHQIPRNQTEQHNTSQGINEIKT